MLLSDRDIKASLDSGRIQLDPLDRDLVQPASIDVRLDRLFRLFDNHRYPVIDPAADQSDLTHLVDVGPTSLSYCTPASSSWAPHTSS